MKKYRKWLIILAILWPIALYLLVTPVWGEWSFDNEAILEDMEVIQDTDKTGANIWLLQAIHGTDGIVYRYAVETDCPQWDFQTRYMTDTPIEWVDDTSAVEVVIYDTQVRYQGSVFASGQYYTVPILGGIASEDVSLEEWQENLVKQAYQNLMQYARTSEDNRLLPAPLLRILVFGIPVIFVIIVCASIFKSGAEREKAWRETKEEKLEEV